RQEGAGRGLADGCRADRDDAGTARESADDRRAERRARRPRRAEREHDPRIDVGLGGPEIGVAERFGLTKDRLVSRERNAAEWNRESPARRHGREDTGNAGRREAVALIGTHFVLTSRKKCLLW